jgi:tetratricopeptide (TPR) repeat protein
VEAEDYNDWQNTYDEMMTLVLARKYEEAISLLEAAIQASLTQKKQEKAASYSGLLSTAFGLAHRDHDSLNASLGAERLDPTNPHYKISTATILLQNIHDAAGARLKAEEAVSLTPSGDPFRYGAIAVLGAARLATGDVDGALAAFAENTSPETMAALRKAEYAGVYDLGLVHALVGAGVAPRECETYLREVRAVAISSGYSEAAIRDIDKLLARISPAV